MFCLENLWDGWMGLLSLPPRLPIFLRLPLFCCMEQWSWWYVPCMFHWEWACKHGAEFKSTPFGRPKQQTELNPLLVPKNCCFWLACCTRWPCTVCCWLFCCSSRTSGPAIVEKKNATLGHQTIVGQKTKPAAFESSGSHGCVVGAAMVPLSPRHILALILLRSLSNVSNTCCSSSRFW